MRVRARAERTKNIWRMVVTLEVSKLSGWLKAGAYCRVEGRGTCEAGRGAGREAGGCGPAAAHARGKARLKAVGGQGTRGAHLEHVAHVRDLGGVKAQRLVERRRVLPSRREGHIRSGAGLRAGRREVGGLEGGGGASGMHGERPDSRLLGARARVGRTWNICFMVMTLEVSKLSGWLKALATCRINRMACGAVRETRARPGCSKACVRQWWHGTGRVRRHGRNER